MVSSNEEKMFLLNRVEAVFEFDFFWETSTTPIHMSLIFKLKTKKNKVDPVKKKLVYLTSFNSCHETLINVF